MYRKPRICRTYLSPCNSDSLPKEKNGTYHTALIQTRHNPGTQPRGSRIR